MRKLTEYEKELAFWHRNNGALDPDAYLAKYRELLGRSMERQVKIYLDTNVWVRLREAELGKGNKDEDQLLQHLREIVRHRVGLCVTHLHSFLEIGRQDETSLRVTAEIVQELTEGVALAPPDELRAWECAAFTQEVVGCGARPPYEKWTKLGLIHKTNLPSEFLPADAIPSVVATTLKCATDIMWNSSIQQICDTFDWQTKAKLSFDIDPNVIAQLEKIREENRTAGRNLKSERTEAFRAHVEEYLRPLFAHALKSAGKYNPTALTAVVTSAEERFARGLLGRSLGLSRLFVDLYCMAVTGNRPITSNDYVDWAHAGAALPNCDLLITERHLAHQLTKLMRADSAFGCAIVAGPKAALQLLTSRYG